MGRSFKICNSSYCTTHVVLIFMEINKLSISGAWQTFSPIMEDHRGYVKETFSFSNNVEKTGLSFNVAQSIFTKSKKGVIRGIHYSLNPLSQWKWITCVSGSILDVVVDIRTGSPTFGLHEEVLLSDTNGMGILLQSNLGHAFQSLTENAIVVYNLSTEYTPEFEKSINPLDKLINIKWPISEQILSEKDINSPTLQGQIQKFELPGI